MAMICCTTREETNSPRYPRLSTKPVANANLTTSAQRSPSPVSAYINAELDSNERITYFQLQAKNRELLLQLAGRGERMGEKPNVQGQVASHLDRLRFEISQSNHLQSELARLQEAAKKLDAGSVQDPGSPVFPGADQHAVAEHQRMATAVMTEIQRISQANSAMISQFDDQVKQLEGQLVVEKRRRQNAEMELRMPPSLRSLSQLRSETQLRPPQAQEATREQQEELARLEAECASLSAELNDLNTDQDLFEAQTLEDLRTAHELQEEELEHFRKLLQEKRLGAAEPAEAATNTMSLLEAELEQLQEHLQHVKGNGARERADAEELASQLRQETRQLQQELESIAVARQQCMQDMEDAKKSSWSSVRIPEEPRRTPLSGAEFKEAATAAARSP